PRATTLAGALIIGMGIIPGLPKLPFFLVGGMMLALGRASKKRAAAVDAIEADTADERALPAPGDAAVNALAVDPLELAIGFVIAPVRIHDDVTLESHEYSIRVRGSEVTRGKIVPGHRLAMNPGDAMPGLAGIPTIEPAFGLPAVWIEDEARAEAEALGYTV